MPTTKNEEELEEKRLLDDDSSDEDDSDNETDSSSDSDSDSGSDSSSESDESDSDSDDDDDDDDSDDDSDSGSDSDNDTRKKKSKKGENEEKKEEEESAPNAIYKIRQISSKLSWLLDDLHKTFKPKSVPKIDPKDVFPYPYISIPQSPTTKQYQINQNVVHIEQPQTHYAPHCKPPISSPLRRGNTVDRGAGGNYIFPSYAAPPSQDEIKQLYRNYSDDERDSIAANQRKERERKFLFSRKSRLGNTWRPSSSFSEKFISASNYVRNQATAKKKLFTSNAAAKKDDEEMGENTMPHTFDELYKHYDEQKRLIEQKQNRLNKMRNKMHWFKKNNNDINVTISEKKPLMDRSADSGNKNGPLVSKSMSQLKKTENNLLNKAAQILLRNGNTSKSSADLYGEVTTGSPDSLQEKILHIASDEEDENRVPTFV